MDIHSSIIKLLKKHLAIDSSLIEVPKDQSLGDFAYPCFIHAKELKKAPQIIAKEIVEKITKEIIKETKGKKSDISGIAKIVATGPYINFFLDSASLANNVLPAIQKQQLTYGQGSATKQQRVMVEYASPNTNKPLHLGHVRNICLGNSVSRLLEFSGKKVVQANINNDRGVHICKSMLAYQRWGKGELPSDKGIKTDHFVGKYYVLFNQQLEKNKKLEEEAQQMLRQWEAGDKETVKLWKLMNTWAYSGFEETYAKLGVAFDKYYYESDIYTKGKEAVMDGVKKKIFYQREDGAICADIPKLDTKVLLRPDGTSVYITQDLYLAVQKFKDNNLDKSVYVVASEQNYHFEVLFSLLKMLAFPWADKCYHLSYGMVYLPHGKMKSREGTVVDADNIIENMKDLAAVEVRKRFNDLSLEEVEKRTRMIGLAALKFYLLKIDPVKDMHFNPQESISFDGETGPYVQYAHARICSVLRKFEKQNNPKKANKGGNKKKSAAMSFANAPVSLLKEKQEAALIKLLRDFPEIVQSAARDYKPSLLCRYLLDVSQRFNTFYHDCPILSEKENIRNARLLLCDCIRIVLEKGLHLLGIQAPEEM